MSVPLLSNRHYEEGLNPWIPELGATLSIDRTNPQWGSACLKVVTAGSVDFEGCASDVQVRDQAVVSVSTQYTISVYVNFPGAVGDELTVFVAQYTTGGAQVVNASDRFVGLGTWGRYAVTFTTASNGARLRDLRVMSRVVGASRTFYVDGWQLDLGATAQPYDGPDAVAGPGGGDGHAMSIYRRRSRRRRQYA